MEILLTRHGQTDWNVLKKVQGKADIELNATGKLQAYETAKQLENEKIDLIISSPLKRAIQTAEIINEKRNVPIIVDERLSERDMGEFEGKTTAEFDTDEFWDYTKNKQYIKAENIKDLFDRVYGFLDDIKEKYKDKKVLLVSHGGISIPVKCYFDGIPDTGDVFHLCIRNCEVVKWQVDTERSHYRGCKI